MKFTPNSDVKYGKNDLLAEDEFDPKYGKERITLFVDQQVVDAFRKEAKDSGQKYQALMRAALRDSVFQSKVTMLEKRLSRLEKKVYKK